MPLVLRSVKGSNLTAAECDGNVTTLEAMINAKAAQGVGIASVALLPNDMLQFQMTDHSYLPAVGPLPTATFRFRGNWTPSTAYLVNDVFNESGSGYIVLVQHTSAATFDPNATDGAAHHLYGLFYQTSTPIPPGGASEAALTKHSGADYDMIWVLPTLAGLTDVTTTTPATGQALMWNGSAWINQFPAYSGPAAVQTKAGTTFTPALSDAETYNRMTNVSGCAVIIPTNASVAFPIGTEIHFRQANIGSVIFTETGNPVLNFPTGFMPSTDIEGATVTCKKVATDAWDVFGLLAVHT